MLGGFVEKSARKSWAPVTWTQPPTRLPSISDTFHNVDVYYNSSEDVFYPYNPGAPFPNSKPSLWNIFDPRECKYDKLMLDQSILWPVCAVLHAAEIFPRDFFNLMLILNMCSAETSRRSCHWRLRSWCKWDCESFHWTRDVAKSVCFARGEWYRPLAHSGCMTTFGNRVLHNLYPFAQMLKQQIKLCTFFEVTFVPSWRNLCIGQL